MEWLFSAGGGHSVFDPYSLVHIVWFIALTTVFALVFRKHVWLAMLGLAFVWELLELWIVDNFPWFPFVGKEDFINKAIGDPICDFLGFYIAWICIKQIRRWKEDE